MGDLVDLGVGGFQLAGEPSAAQVKVEPGGEVRIAEWVYTGSGRFGGGAR
jgi:hypothetical protein